VGVSGLPLVHKLKTSAGVGQLLKELAIDHYGDLEGEAVYLIGHLSIEMRGALSGRGLSFSPERALVGLVGKGWRGDSPLGERIKTVLEEGDLPYTFDQGDDIVLIETAKECYKPLIRVLVDVLMEAL
jgi:hypothetical protein